MDPPGWLQGCVALAALLAALAGAACSPPPVSRGRPPSSLVLVTIDTLRFDRTLPGGPMPRLRAAMEGGLVFTRAVSPVPLTLPSHATILTGTGPETHGVRDNIGYALPATLPALPSILAGEGYATAAFVGGYPLVAGSGIERGFQVYDDHMTRSPVAASPEAAERRAREVVQAALSWLGGRAGEPFFLWVHLFDPHAPYEAPPPHAGSHDHPYDDEVAYADASLGRLLGALREREASDVPWVVITSDHGESLGEHGESTHGIFLYQSTLHVPLVLIPPGGAGASISDRVVTLADIAPTLLEAAGLPVPEEMQGVSFMRDVTAAGRAGRQARTPSDRGAIYLESIHARRRYGWAQLHGLLEWPLKVIAAPEPELYDLEADPAEADSIAGASRAGILLDRLFSIREAAQGATPRAVTESEIERLESLGYAGGASAPLPAGSLDEAGRTDPKSAIAAIPAIEAGLAAMSGRQPAEARRHFEEALRLDPGNLVTLNNLGILSMHGGEAHGAEAFFRRALEVDPRAERILNDLGLALTRQGRHEEAVESYRRALAVRAGFTAARFNMALALHRAGRSVEALRELRRVEREEPGFPKLEETLESVRASAGSGDGSSRD